MKGLEYLVLDQEDQVSTEEFLILLRGKSRHTFEMMSLGARTCHFMDVDRIWDELMLIGEETGYFPRVFGLKPRDSQGTIVAFRPPCFDPNVSWQMWIF